jgi:hypothetical protein
MSPNNRAALRTLRLGVEWLIALAISAFALFVLLNGSFFAPYSALHIDLSINWVASNALRAGMNPYGPSTLRDLAIALESPTPLVYHELFTSYIQPPTSALHLLPLTELPWRDATRLYLVLNHVLLFIAVGVTLFTVRPTIPLRWAIAGACVILAVFNSIFFSFALGQVDPTILLLLSIGFWGYAREKPFVAGTAIACAAAIKLIPGLLLLYFLWKREYRIVLWGAVVGLALLVASWAYVGTDIYRTYVTETLPALTKGSTHYSNTALNAILSRAATPSVIKDLPEVEYLGEVPDGDYNRLAFAGIELAGLAAIAFVAGWKRNAFTPAERPGRLLFEYYFVVAVGLLISSSTWDFYVIWLLPVLLTAFLAPDRVLPRSLPVRVLTLLVFAAVIIGFNYPGDFYLYERNDFFFHPEWVPGKWVEDQVLLYHNHLDAVIFVRLPSLLLCAFTIGGVVLWRRWGEQPVAAKTGTIAEATATP